ncbi:MAG: peroxiredoxin family protein [Actinomycetota bacterium]
MDLPALVAAPLLLAVVLAVSGVGKLRDDDAATAAEWTDLGVPAGLNTRTLRRAHPWAELALALALVVLPGWLGVAAALAAVLLTLAYLMMIARAAARPEPAECACFGTGARTAITGRTVARNAALVLLAVLAVVHAAGADSPLAVLLAAPAATWGWLAALALAVVVVGLLVPVPPAVADDGDEELALPARPSGAAPYDEEGEYLRTLTPFATLEDRDGAKHNIVHLSARQAQLLVFMRAGCGPCTTTGNHVAEWQERMPELALRVVVSQPIDSLEGDYAHWAPFALKDPDGLAGRMLRVSGTPTAVLLGTDGLLAGGPVSGSTAIEEFVEDIAAQLEEARQGMADA